MRRYFWIRTRLFLRQARWGFALISAWFLLGTLVFHYAGGLRFRDAVLNAVYLEKSPGELWDLYSFWGQCVLFGIVISIFFLQALQRYNPQEGCRMLAGELRNHVIVVGYTHLGARVVEHLRESHLPYVLVDRDPAVVDDLVRLGEPVVVDNAKEESTLVDAGIAHAHSGRGDKQCRNGAAGHEEGAGEKSKSAHYCALLCGRVRGNSGNARSKRSDLQL